jgi:hypothetical protein
MDGKLPDEMLASQAGQLFRRVANLDFACRAGFTMTLADVDAEEFIGLKVLHNERDERRAEPKCPAPKMSAF